MPRLGFFAFVFGAEEGRATCAAGLGLLTETFVITGRWRDLTTNELYCDPASGRGDQIAGGHALHSASQMKRCDLNLTGMQPTCGWLSAVAGWWIPLDLKCMESLWVLHVSKIPPLVHINTHDSIKCKWTLSWMSSLNDDETWGVGPPADSQGNDRWNRNNCGRQCWRNTRGRHLKCTFFSGCSMGAFKCLNKCPKGVAQEINGSTVQVSWKEPPQCSCCSPPGSSVKMTCEPTADHNRQFQSEGNGTTRADNSN